MARPLKVPLRFVGTFTHNGKIILKCILNLLSVKNKEGREGE
jgi:hypothetical protein